MHKQYVILSGVNIRIHMSQPNNNSWGGINLCQKFYMLQSTSFPNIFQKHKGTI